MRRVSNPESQPAKGPMPRRPRGHQLESESRAKLRSAIPSLWIYRDLDQDYGIDSEIEIFDESEAATGKKFLVQLKATDEPDLERALRLWFPASVEQYYASLDLPVLIVRYHAQSQRLFARWFHSLDPRNSTRKRTGISFRLDETQAWNESTPARLAEGVGAFREIRSPRLRGPLRFGVSLKSPQIHGLSQYSIRLKLRELAKKIPHLLELYDPDDISNPTAVSHLLFISEERVEVVVGGSPSFTLDGSVVGADADVSAFACDILLSVAIALDEYGHLPEAADIISRFWRESSISGNLRVSFSLARCLARAHQVHCAFEIAETFFHDDSTIEAGQMVLLAFFEEYVRLSDSERTFGVKLLARIARDLEHRSQHQQASALYYTCANQLRALSRFREALHSYRQAAKLDPSYIERWYYFRELGGVFFLSHRYALAARMYQRALDLRKDRTIQCLLADSLMFSGQYRRAEILFCEVLSTPAAMEDAEWVLKCHALHELREETGIDEQRRKIPAYDECFGRDDIAAEQIEQLSQDVFGQDALSGIAWFNLGIARHRSGDDARAVECFLLAALIMPWDLDAWVNTVGLAIQLSNVNLLGHSFCAAYLVNGEGFLLRLSEAVPGAGNTFAAILDELVKTIPGPKHDFTLRLHHGRGAWEEIVPR